MTSNLSYILCLLATNMSKDSQWISCRQQMFFRVDAHLLILICHLYHSLCRSRRELSGHTSLFEGTKFWVHGLKIKKERQEERSSGKREMESMSRRKERRRQETDDENGQKKYFQSPSRNIENVEHRENWNMYPIFYPSTNFVPSFQWLLFSFPELFTKEMAEKEEVERKVQMWCPNGWTIQ